MITDMILRLPEVGGDAGHTSRFRAFASRRPLINDLNGVWGYLHYACRLNHPSIVAELLEVESVDVNLQASGRWTPLMLAACENRVECVKLLLCHPGIDCGIQDCIGKTALEHAVVGNHITTVLWFIALSPQTAVNYLPDPWLLRGNESSDLLRQFRRHPVAVERLVHLKLGLPEACAADIFAIMVLFCDRYLVIPADGECDDTSVSAVRRFLLICQGLPLELQMIMAWRSIGLSRDLVATAASDVSFAGLLCPL